jgi:hypothetical protein
MGRTLRTPPEGEAYWTAWCPALGSSEDMPCYFWWHTDSCESAAESYVQEAFEAAEGGAELGEFDVYVRDMLGTTFHCRVSVEMELAVRGGNGRRAHSCPPPPSAPTEPEEPTHG